MIVGDGNNGVITKFDSMVEGTSQHHHLNERARYKALPGWGFFETSPCRGVLPSSVYAISSPKEAEERIVRDRGTVF